MVLPGLAQPHTGSPHPPGGARLGPEVPPAPEGAKIQRKPWAAAALREQGHSPGTPSPSQPGAALPTPGREQGTQGHQRGSPSHARPPMAPGQSQVLPASHQDRAGQPLLPPLRRLCRAGLPPAPSVTLQRSWRRWQRGHRDSRHREGTGKHGGKETLPLMRGTGRDGTPKVASGDSPDIN